MTRARMLTPLVLLAALLSLSATARAQDTADAADGLPVERALLEGFYQKSGVGVGLAVKDQAVLEGRSFDTLAVTPTERPAFGLEVLYRGRNVLVMRDNDGAVQRAGFGGQSAWSRITSEVYRLYPDQFDMVMALTTWTDNSSGAAYYLPLANQIRGLGYQHLTGVEVFRQTQSQELDGLVFMNNYRTYLGQNAVYGRIVFLQEIGHRWGAFVWYANGPADGRDMLGRDDSHWSYFLDSRNSGMEGNAWRDNNNGAFTTETNAFTLGYGDLDLYLMGFKPKNSVEPWFLLRDPDVGTKRDDYGSRLNPASPPAFGGRVTLVGDRWDITIDDVVETEGERNPPYDRSQKYWKVGTVLVVGQNASFGESDLRVVEGLLDDWEQMFEEESGFAADLDFQLEDNPQIPTQGFGDSCDASSDCDPSTATTCLTTDDGRICSHRCVQASDCGNGYCCAESFCYPSGDSVCGGAANNGGNNGTNNGTNNGANNGGNNNDPFIEDPFVNDGDNASAGAGSSSQTCTVAALPGRSAGPLAVALTLVAGLLVALRRR